MDNCSEASVPLYSVVAGSLAIALILFIGFVACATEGSCCYGFSIGLAVCVTLAHFGVQCWGSYVVFRRWQDWRADDFSCDKDTYLLSFSTLIIYWTLGLCLCKMGKGD